MAEIDPQQPKRVSEGDQSVEHHSLREQIEAEKFANSKRVGRRPHLAIRTTRIIPPGTV